MRTVSTILIVTILFASGCVEHKHRRHKPKHTDDDIKVVVDAKTAATIHKQSAAKRADIYFKIAAAVESGELATVQSVVDFSNPMFAEAGMDYVKEINALRQARLAGADDKLPANAAEVFKKFAEEYNSVAK